MAVKYINLSVEVHGIDAAPESILLLAQSVHLETKVFLLRHQELFNFRNEFDSDITVEIDASAGNVVPYTGEHHEQD